MKQHLLHALKLYGDRALLTVINLIMLPVFLPIIGWGADETTMVGIGSVLYSLMICSIYLGITADAVWKIGLHDRKSYATEKYYPWKGLVIGLISEAPVFIHFILAAVFPSVANFRTFYRLFGIGPYMGFVAANKTTVGYGLVLLIVPILSAIFYYVGYNRKFKEQDTRLSHKILYKKQK